MAYGFKYLLVYADGEPVDPGMVTFPPAQRWDVGDVFMISPKNRFRILDVQPPTIKGKEAEITAYWTVEKV
jgi:hypothetical protein